MGIKSVFNKLMLIEEDEGFTTEEILEEENRQTRRMENKRFSSDTYMDRIEKPDTSTKNPVKSSAKPIPRSMSLNNPNSFKMIIVEPENFEQATNLVDSLRTRKPIIVNLENIETDVARKIFDFLSGAIYALNGKVEKISNNIFAFTPENITVVAEKKDMDNVSSFDFKTDSKSW